MEFIFRASEIKPNMRIGSIQLLLVFSCTFEMSAQGPHRKSRSAIWHASLAVVRVLTNHAPYPEITMEYLRNLKVNNVGLYYFWNFMAFILYYL